MLQKANFLILAAVYPHFLYKADIHEFNDFPLIPDLS
jgi:hypothetical protein